MATTMRQLAILLALTAPALGADISFKVNGPPQTQVGRRVHLSVEFTSKGDIPETVLRVQCLRQTDPAAVIDWDQSDDGRSVYIWADPGTYDIEFEAFEVANAKNSLKKTHRLEVSKAPEGGSPPIPKPRPNTPDNVTPPGPIPPGPIPPTPNPQPRPEPQPEPGPQPVPAGEFGVAPKIADAVKRLVPAAEADGVKKLATAIDGIAAQIAAGTIPDAKVLLDAVSKAVGECGSPTVKAQWAHAVGETINTALTDARLELVSKSAIGPKMYFKTPSAWATLMREVAVGVRAGGK